MKSPPTPSTVTVSCFRRLPTSRCPALRAEGAPLHLTLRHEAQREQTAVKLGRQGPWGETALCPLLGGPQGGAAKWVVGERGPPSSPRGTTAWRGQAAPPGPGGPAGRGLCRVSRGAPAGLWGGSQLLGASAASSRAAPHGSAVLQGGLHTEGPQSSWHCPLSGSQDSPKGTGDLGPLVEALCPWEACLPQPQPRRFPSLETQTGSLLRTNPPGAPPAHGAEQVRPCHLGGPPCQLCPPTGGACPTPWGCSRGGLPVTTTSGGSGPPSCGSRSLLASKPFAAMSQGWHSYRRQSLPLPIRWSKVGHQEPDGASLRRGRQEPFPRVQGDQASRRGGLCAPRARPAHLFL